jgi:hypothetical protein
MGRSDKPKNAETGYRDLFVATDDIRSAPKEESGWPPINDYISPEELSRRIRELAEIEKRWLGNSRPAAARLLYDLQKSYNALVGYAFALEKRRLCAMDLVAHAQRQPSFVDERIKAWIIDQVTQIIAGQYYGELVASARHGENGPTTHEWDEGLTTRELADFLARLHTRFIGELPPSDEE